MAQHLSVRVPWHDNGWKGTICKEPSANTSCLRLKNILENRIVTEEYAGEGLDSASIENLIKETFM